MKASKLFRQAWATISLLLMPLATVVAKEVVIPEGTTVIEEYSYYADKSITSVKIPFGVVEIGEGAFSWCNSLTSVSIPMGVTQIDYAAFANCSSLKSIVFTHSVTLIDKGAFSGCPLDTIVFVGSDEEWANLSKNYDIPEVDNLIVIDGTIDEGKSFVAFFDGDSIVKLAVGKPGDKISVPVLNKTGHTFLGWQPNIPSTFPTQYVVTRADWKRNKYGITYQYDDGSVYHVDSLLYGDQIRVWQSPYKEGYSFAGWDKELPPTMPAQDLTLKATFRINTYTVSFYDDTDDPKHPLLLKSITGEYGSPVVAPAASDVQKKDYIFEGWEPPVPATMPAKNVSFYAQYRWNDTLFYEGTLAEFCMEDGKNLYVFHYNHILIDGIDIMELNTIKIPQGVTELGYSAFVGFPLLKNVIVPPSVTTLGSAFWDRDLKIVISNSLVSYNHSGNDTILYVGTPAQWETLRSHSNGFTGQKTVFFLDESVYSGESFVVFVDQDSVVQLSVGDVGSRLVAPTLQREGYTLVGWNQTVPETIPSDFMVLSAVWEKNYYQVTYKYDKDSIARIDSVGYGDKLPSFAVDSEGYEFVGWGPILPEVMPARNLTLMALFEPKTYVASYTDRDGKMIAQIEVKCGDALEAPKAPIVSGLAFSGWSPELPSTMPAHNMKFVATYEKSDTLFFDGTFADWCGKSHWDNNSRDYDYRGFKHVIVEGVDIMTASSLVLPDNVKVIKDDAFILCDSLKRVIFPDGVEISCDVFGNLSYVEFQRSFDLYGKACPFHSIDTVVYKGTLSEWCDYDLCSDKEDLMCTFGNLNTTDDTTVAKHIFIEGVDIKTAKSIVIPEGVTAIGDYSFARCDSLKKIVIPKSVKDWGRRSFFGCPLDTIVYMGNKEEWSRWSRSDKDLIEVLNTNPVVIIMGGDQESAIDDLQVTIKGERDTVTYDGKTHSVQGYTIHCSDSSYQNTSVMTNHTAQVEGLKPGEYYMGLSAKDFVNIDPRYKNVEFVVEDGLLVILPQPELNEEIEVTPDTNSAVIKWPSYEGLSSQANTYGSVGKNTQNGLTISHVLDYKVNVESADRMLSTGPLPHYTVAATTGLELVDVTLLTIYPNPTTDVLVLKTGELSNVSFLLSDAEGRTLQKSEIASSKTSIDFSNYASGVYYLTLTQKGKAIKSFSIIKK